MILLSECLGYAICVAFPILNILTHILCFMVNRSYNYAKCSQTHFLLRSNCKDFRSTLYICIILPNYELTIILHFVTYLPSDN